MTSNHALTDSLQSRAAATDLERNGKETSADDLDVDLVAVVVAVTQDEPRILAIGAADALPFGPFQLGHRTLQAGLRSWAERQTGHPLGYIEQLYTFADSDRAQHRAQRIISISYLALMREEQGPKELGAFWRSWYDYFPWEDHRRGAPVYLEKWLAPRLAQWSNSGDSSGMREERSRRVSICFGFHDQTWNEELVLQRYELLYEAQLIPESVTQEDSKPEFLSGKAMFADHRRILATGIARLRAKIKYNPVVFELMPEAFTLLQLQRCFEALAGRLAHKQNFRRLIEERRLVEETGMTASGGSGRPAKLFRFRQEVVAERAIAGMRLPLPKA